MEYYAKIFGLMLPWCLLQSIILGNHQITGQNIVYYVYQWLLISLLWWLGYNNTIPSFQMISINMQNIFLDTAESLGIIPLKIKLLDPLKIKIIRNKIINP